MEDTSINTSKVHNRRPLSPHLTIYKPQLSSVLSITHRLTGISLFIGTILLSWWIIMSIYSSFNSKYMMFDFFSSIIGKGLLFCWSAALFYHLLNGIRHLFWDAGYGFEVKTADRTAIAVLIGTIVLTGATWGIILL
jgi:succinate dehydrogenase / fumarate reductase cytochrome b subunit